MTDLAWMKTYIGDEAAIAGHLSAEEFGAYERLRRHYWQHSSLPKDEARLLRITAADPTRWSEMAGTLYSLLAEALPKIDLERATASSKREKKIAAGQKGAAVRWGTDGKTNANANGKNIKTPMAEPLRKQRPPAPGEVRHEEGLAPIRTHARAREAIPLFTDRLAAGRWLADHMDLFPGDPTFDLYVDKAIAGSLTWADVDGAAA